MKFGMTMLKTAPLIFLMWLTIMLAAGYGWVMNIVKIAHMGFEPFTGMVVFRCVGVFVPPLGVVLGYVS